MASLIRFTHDQQVHKQQRTGLAPKAVTAVLSEDTLVVTLHNALTGAVMHAFTTGAMVQMFLLTPRADSNAATDRDAIDRANDDGFRPAPKVDTSR